MALRSRGLQVYSGFMCHFRSVKTVRHCDCSPQVHHTTQITTCTCIKCATHIIMYISIRCALINVILVWGSGPPINAFSQSRIHICIACTKLSHSQINSITLQVPVTSEEKLRKRLAQLMGIDPSNFTDQDLTVRNL